MTEPAVVINTGNEGRALSAALTSAPAGSTPAGAPEGDAMAHTTSQPPPLRPIPITVVSRAAIEALVAKLTTRTRP